MEKRRNLIQFRDASGTGYDFHTYELAARFLLPGKAGIYCFSKFSNNMYIPLYFGETNDFSRRMKEHEDPSEGKMPCVREHGGTHVHILLGLDDQDSRRRIEDALIHQYTPVCNEQV